MRLPRRFFRSVFSNIASLAREVQKSQHLIWRRNAYCKSQTNLPYSQLENQTELEIRSEKR